MKEYVQEYNSNIQSKQKKALHNKNIIYLIDAN